MRTVIQKVNSGRVCEYNTNNYSSIGKGLVIYCAFTHEDTPEIIEKMANKILKLRIFEDENGKLNESIKDVRGEVLIISQFTLYADTRKNNRPSFLKSSKKEEAFPLYNAFCEVFNREVHTRFGYFGKRMLIEQENDGPVTVIIDSEEM